MDEDPRANSLPVQGDSTYEPDGSESDVSEDEHDPSAYSLTRRSQDTSSLTYSTRLLERQVSLRKANPGLDDLAAREQLARRHLNVDDLPDSVRSGRLGIDDWLEAYDQNAARLGRLTQEKRNWRIVRLALVVVVFGAAILEIAGWPFATQPTTIAIGLALLIVYGVVEFVATDREIRQLEMRVSSPRKFYYGMLDE
jgi:hypothetical protein